MTGSTILFYGGIVLMAGAAIAALIAIVVLRTSGKRITRQLQKEYGKKRC